jgi:hypothetical protein
MGDALNDQPRRFVSASVVVAHGEWGAVYKLNTKALDVGKSLSARLRAVHVGDDPGLAVGMHTRDGSRASVAACRSLMPWASTGRATHQRDPLLLSAERRRRPRPRLPHQQARRSSTAATWHGISDRIPQRTSTGSRRRVLKLNAGGGSCGRLTPSLR